MLNPISPRCSACKDGVQSPFPFSMAFQPIVELDSGVVFAYEALVRGTEGQTAGAILSQVTDENRYAFDQNCRVRALTLASQLGLSASGAHLSVNFMPGAVYSPVACIQLTLKTAQKVGFPLNKIIFELTENEKVLDRTHLRAIVTEYRRHGFKIAIDDFGAGYSGLNLLADIPADIVKLDMDLIRGLPRRPRAREITRHVVELATSLGANVIAEGVETLDELLAIRDCGVSTVQGYLMAKPAFESLPEVNLRHLQLASSTPFQDAVAGHPAL